MRNRKTNAAKLLAISVLMAALLGTSGASHAAKKAEDKKAARAAKKQSAIDKFNQVHEVDQDVVAKFKEAVSGFSAVKPAQPRKLLVYGISHGPHRFNIPTAKVIFEELGTMTGAYTAVVSDDLAHFEPEALKDFDAVCFANTTGDVFSRPIARHLFNELSDADKKAQAANATRLVKNLTEYVRNGGGFFAIHAATDTLKKEAAYGEMIGGYFDGHPWGAKNTVMVRVEEPGNALCQGLFEGGAFSISDEIYQLKAPYAREKLRVLMSVDVEKSDKPPAERIKRKDGDFPISWVKPYGKGRVFYCSLGHNLSTLHNPAVLEFWLRGLQYSLGDRTAEDGLR